MRLHEVIPALFEGKEIRQTSAPELHYRIAVPADVIMYEPRGTLAPLHTQFGYDDLVVDDWEVVS